MPTLSFGSGPAKNFGFTGEVPIAESLKFPVNTLIPYYGADTDPGLSGWTRHILADGCCIESIPNWTTTPNTKVAANPASISFSGSVGTGGAHSGTSVYQNLYSSGSYYANNATDAGHTHSISGGTSFVPVATNVLNVQNITFLRATSSRKTLPAKTLVIQQTAPTNSIAFSKTGSNFLMGGTNLNYTTATSNISFAATPSIASAGSHSHSGSTRHLIVPTGQRFYAWNLGYAGASAHAHTASSSTFTQSQIAHKLVNLWQLTAEARANNGVIVMYVGTAAALPSTWVLCNGLNGTPNLSNYIIGYSDGQWDIIKTSNASATSGIAIGSAYVPHTHDAGYSAANLAASSYPGIIANGQHTNYNWSHTHTSNIAVSAGSYLPPRLRVAFIQFKG